MKPGSQHDGLEARAKSVVRQQLSLALPFPDRIIRAVTAATAAVTVVDTLKDHLYRRYETRTSDAHPVI
jgi:hypothetical protein